MEKLRVEMEKCSEGGAETLLGFMAVSSGGEEQRNWCMLLAGNLQATSGKEVFEEIRKTTTVLCKAVF